MAKTDLTGLRALERSIIRHGVKVSLLDFYANQYSHFYRAKDGYVGFNASPCEMCGRLCILPGFVKITTCRKEELLDTGLIYWEWPSKSITRLYNCKNLKKRTCKNCCTGRTQ